MFTKKPTSERWVSTNTKLRYASFVRTIDEAALLKLKSLIVATTTCQFLIFLGQFLQVRRPHVQFLRYSSAVLALFLQDENNPGSTYAIYCNANLLFEHGVFGSEIYIEIGLLVLNG